MGSLSIQKGKRAERAVASILNTILDSIVCRHGLDPVALKRNLSQTQQGGFDLEGLPWIAIEIKHHKTLAIPSWWRQTCQQAGTDELGAGIVGKSVREPVLIWKQHGGKWCIRMIGRLEIEAGRRIRVPVDVSLEHFLIWFEKRAELELIKSTMVQDNSCNGASLFG